MGLEGVGGVLGTYTGRCGGDGSGRAVHMRASSKGSRATYYGVEWCLGGGLGEVGARLGEGGEGGSVDNGGWGKACSLRHFSASESLVATRVGLQTAGAPANLLSNPGRKGWRGQKRPR